MLSGNITNIFKSDKVNETYKIKNGTYNKFSDDLPDDEYIELLCNSLNNALNYSDDVLYNIGILATTKKPIIEMLYRNMSNFCDLIVWHKENPMPMGLQQGLITHSCEFVFCFNQNGTRVFSHPQWKDCKFMDELMTNYIKSRSACQNEYAKTHHATFPIEFASQIVERFSDNIVLDLFGGTGTTLIACEQLNRKCRMMEIDPHYCDVIIARWEQLTGKKAVKLE